MKNKYRISDKELNHSLPEDLFDFDDTSQLDPLDEIISQERAIEAIDFGLNMKGPDYHIFVTGLEGTGKSTIVKQLLMDHAKNQATSEDLCLVNNFEDEYCPVVIEMPPGSAVYFSRSMLQFVELLKIKIPELLETDSFQEEQKITQTKYIEQQNEIFNKVETLAQDQGLTIMRAESDYRVVPLYDGQPMAQEMYMGLEENERQKIENKAAMVEEYLNDSLIEMNKINQEMTSRLKDLIAIKTEALISEQIDPVRYYFRDCEDIQKYLHNVKEDIIENIAMFLGFKGQDDSETTEFSRMADAIVRKYQVNVLVDRRRESGAPVVIEPNPTFANLFGKIEKKPVMGSIETDFTMVQAGSLLKANNGYLIIDIEPLLSNTLVWDSLKRTLKGSMLQIEDIPDQAGYRVPSIKPAPIPLTVKVVLVGGYEPFRILQNADSKFNKIFRVRADFDYETEKTKENVYAYARFISRTCKQEELLNITPKGVYAIIDYSSRIVSDQSKLSLRFGQIVSVLKEADYWARKEAALLVCQNHVAKALYQYRFRHNLYEEKVLDQFDDQSVLIDVKGKEIGQVNALAVYEMGEIAFGRPTRITAESYMGNPGIVNVEHESDLSGQTHDKGVMIISGYLGRMFAQNYPLSVSISITFEQSYDGIDGDSASSTELYAVLSSLSGIPIRQDIAVTGSVNQKGEIQAIGGVNEKIEGFFDICMKKGFTKNQGVMIPESNVRNLVLRQDIIDAVKNKQFSIYKVKTIEQGIEVMTGLSAGVPDVEFNYPEDSIFGRVQKKLEKYHELSMRYAK